MLPRLIINNGDILLRIIGRESKTIISTGDNLRFTFDDFDKFKVGPFFFVMFINGEFRDFLNVRIFDVFDGAVTSEDWASPCGGGCGGDHGEERKN